MHPFPGITVCDASAQPLKIPDQIADRVFCPVAAVSTMDFCRMSALGRKEQDTKFTVDVLHMVVFAVSPKAEQLPHDCGICRGINNMVVEVPKVRLAINPRAGDSLSFQAGR